MILRMRAQFSLCLIVPVYIFQGHPGKKGSRGQRGPMGIPVSILQISFCGFPFLGSISFEPVR